MEDEKTHLFKDEQTPFTFSWFRIDVWDSFHVALSYNQDLGVKKFITYYDIILRAWEEITMKIPAKLKELETEILNLKGVKREAAMREYRKLLFSLESEPIYFLRS